MLTFTYEPKESEANMTVPTEINNEIYLNTSEAMSHLGVSRPTLESLVSDKRLTRYKQGIRKTHYYKLSDLDKLLELREDTGNR